jgi:hypothetical protein
VRYLVGQLAVDPERDGPGRRDGPDSFHVATLDHDAPAIFAGTVTFIKEHGCKD